VQGHTFIIAEAGVNHDGAIATAKDLIDVAADAGADAVKFQTFRAEELVAASAPQADYQRKNIGHAEAQIDMIRRLELSADQFRELAQHCKQRRILFMSTPFDRVSLDLLVHKIDVDRLKFSSGDITNAPLLLHGARSGRPIILSTGMSTLADIENALGVIAWGYANPSGTPDSAQLGAAYASESGRAALTGNVTLLHCTSEYPAPINDINLRAMDTLARTFGLPVGLSDHSSGVAVSVAAVALGATVIEKHFTLDRNRSGPDHRASLEPAELHRLVAEIRAVEQALGSGIKEVTASEQKNVAVGRRSVVAKQPIKAGETFTESNLTVKRPGTGISPMHFWDCLGRPAKRDYMTDELIEP
jgi:N-acetylneuraminate synthase